MNAPRQSPRPRQRKQARPTPAANFWRDNRTPPEPIVPAADPTALIRSLGPAPLADHLSAYYVASVVERASTLAAALAASADLLAPADED